MGTAQLSSAALARCVGDVGSFVRDHWARRPLLVRDPGGRRFDDLLDLDAVDHLLGGTFLRRPAFRLVRDGTPLDPARYTRSTRLGGRPLHDVADVGKVHTLVDEGATLVLQGLQRWWPPLTAFCRELELDLGHAVQANAYVTPAAAQGLGLHADEHDVFLLQVHGRKHWEVHGLGAADGDAPELDTHLEPGDTVYLPKGARHAARTTGSPSIHLTIGILATTWADVLGRVAAEAVASLEDDEPLPPAFGADPVAAEAAVAERLAVLRDRLAAVDPADVVAAERRRFVGSRAPLLTGQLRNLFELDALDDDTPLRRRPGAVVDVVVDDGRTSLVLGDRTVSLPAPFEPVLRDLLTGDPVRGRDLAGRVDEHSRLVLLRRLVREGVLEPVR